MKTKHIDLNRILGMLGFMLFAAAFLFLCYVIRTKSWTGLDSDMSSELILAKMLKDEGRILTPNWYYSTELRIVYYTQIAALLFNFTDNWYLVRVYSDIIMLCIYVFSAWCLAVRIGLRRYFPVLGIIILMPFSSVYSHFVLFTSCYIPYIAGSFLGLSLAVHYTQVSDKRTRVIIMLTSGVLALLTSLSGYRQLVLFYFPLIISAVLGYLTGRRDDKSIAGMETILSYIRVVAVGTVCSLAGCVINACVLVKKYTVADWSGISFDQFSPETLINTIFGMIRNLGFREEKIGAGTLIANGYSVLIFAVSILAVITIVKSRSESVSPCGFTMLYFASAIVIFALLYAFTDMIYYDLYSIPIMIFTFPVVFLFLDRINIRTELKGTIGIAVSLLVSIVSVHTYGEIIHNDNTSQLRDIAAYVSDQGYETGYGTFWNANVMTELSNGRIDMYNWEDAKMLSYVKSVDDIQHWLQKVSHNTERPVGKVFHIYNRDELFYCNWSDGLDSDDIIYETSDYIVYGYGSYDEMRSRIMQ